MIHIIPDQHGLAEGQGGFHNIQMNIGKASFADILVGHIRRDDHNISHPIGQGKILKDKFTGFPCAVDQFPAAVLMPADVIGQKMLPGKNDIIHGATSRFLASIVANHVGFVHPWRWRTAGEKNGHIPRQSKKRGGFKWHI